MVQHAITVFASFASQYVSRRIGAASSMLVDEFTVQSPNVTYTDEYITSTYNYDSTKLTRTEKGAWVVSPTSTQYQFRVDRRVPKLGCVPV